MIPDNIFDQEPKQWGLRGDPGLWREMRTRFIEYSQTTPPEQLPELLMNLFKESVGQSPTPGNNIYVAGYDVGGMSRGMVSSDFWLNTAFPLLLQRAQGK